MHSPSPRILRSKQVVLPEDIAPRALVLDGGKIAAIHPYEAPPKIDGVEVETLEGLLLAGIVDTHVHVNEPGRTAWEGYQTATRAAARGGTTTLVDMPLNCIPVTTTLEAYQEKLRHLAEKLTIDTGFWGGVVPGNQDQLEPMVEAGVLGFKAFMIHSGIDDFPASDKETLRQAMQILARLDVPLLLHAELDLGAAESSGAPQDYQTFLDSRPPSWEVAAIEMAIELVRETGCRAHIVHLSAADALDAIQAAKQEGLPLSVETCPHYLLLEAEAIPRGATAYKCCPPIRPSDNRERLWQALSEGIIDCIVSDHSPCTADLKLLDQGDFDKAWGGISGLQFGLPLILAEAQRRGFGPLEVSRWMSARTADLAGLGARKGRIALGKDADLVQYLPGEGPKILAETIEHRNKVTPYLGHRLEGDVLQTILRGKTIYLEDAFSKTLRGEPLERPPFA